MSVSDLILARINAQVPGLNSTGVAANLAAIKTGTMQFPAVFVVPISRAGTNNRYMTGVVAQRRELRVQIVSAVRNIAGKAGNKAISDIEQLSDLVDGALFGWTPAPDYDPLVLQSGRMLEMVNGECWWVDEYVTAFDRRA